MRNTAQPCFPTNVALPRRTVLRSRVLISYGADPPIGHWRLAPGTKPLPGQQGKRPMEPDSKGPHALRVFSSKPQKEGMKNMTSVNPVLVISPEKEHHEKINAAMSKCGLSSISCMTFEEARIFVSAQKFGVVFCHDTLPDGDFCSVVSAAKPTPVVMLSRFAEWDHYLAALRAGAFDYIACPLDSSETERIAWSAMGGRR